MKRLFITAMFLLSDIASAGVGGGSIGAVGSSGGGAVAPTTMSGASVTCAAGAGASTLSLDLSCPATNGVVIVPLINSDIDGCAITVAETSALAGCEAIIWLVSSTGGTVTLADVSNIVDVDGSWTPAVGDNLMLEYEDLANDRWQELGRNKSWNAANDGAGSGLDADLLDGFSSAAFYPIDTITTYSATTGVVINDTGIATFDVTIEGDADTALFCTDAADDQLGLGTCAPTKDIHFLDPKNGTQSFWQQNTTGGTASLSQYLIGAGVSGNYGAIEYYDDANTSTLSPGLPSDFALSDSFNFASGSTSGKGFIFETNKAGGRFQFINYDDIVFKDTFKIADTEVVVNDSSAGTIDFRAETDTNANGIFLDASAETIDLVGGSGSTGCSISSAGALTCTIAPTANGVLLRAPIVTTSGTTYTTGASTTLLLVELCGAGGGGGGADGDGGAGIAAGSGGGGGGFARKAFVVTASTGYTIAIGAAGAAGAANGGTGGTGGNTTFLVGATTVTGFGGTGGGSTGDASVVFFQDGGAGGAVSTNGDLNSGGQPGEAAAVHVSKGIGGGGGSSYFGAGARSQPNDAAGSVGTGFCAGGGGGNAIATDRAGGAGTAGVIYTWEFSTP